MGWIRAQCEFYCCCIPTRSIGKINLFKFIPNVLNVKLSMGQISGEVRIKFNSIYLYCSYIVLHLMLQRPCNTYMT